jgi:predicted phosphodiesterase
VFGLLKKLFKFIILLALLYAGGRTYVVITESRLTGDRAPYVQETTQNSAVIRWLTSDFAMGVVRYGEDPRFPEQIALEESPVKNHSLTLSGLKPGTRYYYQVGDINRQTYDDPERYWFETAHLEPKPTRIWVIGDSGEPGEVQANVRDSALNWSKQNPLTEDHDGYIDVWLSLGDLAYRSGSNAQFQAGLFEPYAALLANTALWPVYGNHDQRRLTYFRVFDLPENGEAGGVASGTENYYAFDYANIHFIMLDSQSSDRSTSGPMYRWLKEDLAVNTQPWVIVAMHHPPYTKGSHDSDSVYDSRGRMQDMRENFLPLLESAGVDLVLSGHSHMYERSQLIDCYYADSQGFNDEYVISKGIHGKHKEYLKPANVKSRQGTIYMVAGSSSKADSGPLDHPVHVTALQEPGSVMIDIDNDRMTVRFINDKQQIRDEFTITKQQGYAPVKSKCADAE